LPSDSTITPTWLTSTKLIWILIQPTRLAYLITTRWIAPCNTSTYRNSTFASLLPFHGVLLLIHVRLLASGQYSDFKITCDTGTRSKTFNVHRAILSNRSAYFRNTIKDDTFKEGQEKHARLEDDPAIMEYVLQYIYCMDYEVPKKPPTQNGTMGICIKQWEDSWFPRGQRGKIQHGLTHINVQAMAEAVAIVRNSPRQPGHVRSS